MNGDRYEQMARRISEKVNISQTKAMNIARTESHRNIESGFMDCAENIQDGLDGSEFIYAATWRTMKDGNVRPYSRRRTKSGWKTYKSSSGADHTIMEGVTVKAGEMFDLQDGNETKAPGKSGIAAHDCNCRCYLEYNLMTEKEFAEATNQTVDEVREKYKTVENSENSGIMELTRNKNYTHRKIGAEGQQIIDTPTYNKLTKKFVDNGGIIIRGEDAETHLKQMNAYASYLPSFNTVFIRDDATVSDVLEEMYHAEQESNKVYSNLAYGEMTLRREIDAQKYLLSLTEKYNIPVEEVNVTKANLAEYEKELKKLLKKE